MIVDQVEKNKIYDVLTSMAQTGKLLPFTVSKDGAAYVKFTVTKTSADLDWLTEPEQPAVVTPEAPAAPEAPQTPADQPVPVEDASAGESA